MHRFQGKSMEKYQHSKQPATMEARYIVMLCVYQWEACTWFKASYSICPFLRCSCPGSYGVALVAIQTLRPSFPKHATFAMLLLPSFALLWSCGVVFGVAGGVSAAAAAAAVAAGSGSRSSGGGDGVLVVFALALMMLLLPLPESCCRSYGFHYLPGQRHNISQLWGSFLALCSSCQWTGASMNCKLSKQHLEREHSISECLGEPACAYHKLRSQRR